MVETEGDDDVVADKKEGKLVDADDDDDGLEETTATFMLSGILVAVAL